MSTSNTPRNRGRIIPEQEAWSAVLAVKNWLATRSETDSPADRECRILCAGDSFELTSGAENSQAASIAVSLSDGRIEISDRLPEKQATLFELYLPLCQTAQEFAVGHLGQSLDGRIATRSGASQYVTGPSDILHIHRMRALFDTIIVGAGTVAHDDPQLTTRLCEGENPVRVVIDSERRLDASFQLFCDDAAPTILVCASDRLNGQTHHGAAELLGVERCEDGLSPRAIFRALATKGCRRHYIEGGGVTVSRFLHAGCLDRLQVTVSPLIIGSGRPAISLPEVASLSDGLRPRTRRFDLGQDIMIECLFDG